MAGLRVHVVMPQELVERIDAARGDGSRGEFVRRAVEQALGGAVKDSSGVDRAEPPAPAEQPLADRILQESRNEGSAYVTPRPPPEQPEGFPRAKTFESRRSGPDVAAFRRATQR